MSLHPILADAARGALPGWSEADEARREHMGRVAELMEAWARNDGLPESEVARWRAAAWLHDAVRDADPEALRPRVPPGLDDLPPRCLHGPAAAERLRLDGVDDGELLTAVAYHTLGHVRLGRLGRALYAADFLEPGRDLLNEWRAGLRDRLPGALDPVVRDVLGARIAHLMEKRTSLRPETVAFWNALVEEGV